MRRGRLPKLDAGQARDVRERFAKGETQLAIARSLSVSPAVISAITRGVTYKKAGGPTFTDGTRREGFHTPVGPGWRPPNAHFTDDEVREIRELYALGASQRELAELTESNEPTISNITRGVTYASAGGPIFRDGTTREGYVKRWGPSQPWLRP